MGAVTTGVAGVAGVPAPAGGRRVRGDGGDATAPAAAAGRTERESDAEGLSGSGGFEASALRARLQGRQAGSIGLPAPPGTRYRGPATGRTMSPRVPRLLSLAVLLPFLWGGTADAKKDLTVDEQYELGLRYLKRGYYVKAMETFNRIRNYHRDDPMAVKAELAIADLHFEKSEWDQARFAYEDFVRMHPRHPDIDYVTYRVGETLYRKSPRAAGRDQTWARQAVNTWSGFDDRFPESEHRDAVLEKLEECRDRLALKELQVARFYERRCLAAGGRAAGLVRMHPDSQHVPEALAPSQAMHGRRCRGRFPGPVAPPGSRRSTGPEGRRAGRPRTARRVLKRADLAAGPIEANVRTPGPSRPGRASTVRRCRRVGTAAPKAPPARIAAGRG